MLIPDSRQQQPAAARSISPTVLDQGSSAAEHASMLQIHKPDSPKPSSNDSQILQDILARISRLERDNRQNQTHISEQERSSADSSESPVENYTVPLYHPNLEGLATPEVIYGSSSLNEPIETLKRNFGLDAERGIDDDCQEFETSPLGSSVPDGRTIQIETRLIDSCALHQTIDTYFLYLNPNYPIINENEFRSQLKDFLSTNSNEGNNSPRFAALINLMQAEVKGLYDDSSDPNHVPGWAEFCQAERVLSSTSWLGDGDIFLIQCLSIKTRYLLYRKKPMGAYHSIGQATRLCFQLGLHNQSMWKNCTPFEIIMRQRVFWVIFYLERHVSFNCGMPYTIREEEINIDLPPNLDDRFVFPDKPLPQESQGLSFIPYLSCIVTWGKMCSTLWDKVFRFNNPKPINLELVASVDAVILYTASRFPRNLQWAGNTHRLEGNADVPSFVLRHTLTLHLVFGLHARHF